MENNNNNTKPVSIALWKAQTNGGKSFVKGVLNLKPTEEMKKQIADTGELSIQIYGFKNGEKKTDRSPDMILYESKSNGEKKSEPDDIDFL